MNILNIIKKLHPNLNEDGVILQDDGDGVYIKEWNSEEQMPTMEELEETWEQIKSDCCLDEIRVKRNQLLTESDWTQLNDSPLSNEQKEQWKLYRQQLRDLPEECDPFNPIFPTKPL